MSLITIYGINAVGKDTVANVLRREDSNVLVTSESRMLMYHLGFVPSFETSYQATREEYKRLENTSQEEVTGVISSRYREHLTDLSQRPGSSFLLSHLVFALSLDRDKAEFINQEIQPWMRDVVDGFVHLRSDPVEIVRRRGLDSAFRDRGFILGIGHIAFHQRLCDEKWKELVAPLSRDRYIEVKNENLETAVAQVRGFKERFR